MVHERDLVEFVKGEPESSFDERYQAAWAAGRMTKADIERFRQIVDQCGAVAKGRMHRGIVERNIELAPAIIRQLFGHS